LGPKPKPGTGVIIIAWGNAKFASFRWSVFGPSRAGSPPRRPNDRPPKSRPLIAALNFHLPDTKMWPASFPAF
jgi:hypothetical protein